MTELQCENLFEFGEVPEIDDRRCEEKSNEGWLDDEYTQRKIAFNPWYCIPSIPYFPEPILEPGPFHSLGPNDKLIVNQTYNTKKERIQGWSVSGVDNTTYQVHDFKSSGIVNLRENTYSCRYWQLTGLPCGHVIMVLTHLKNDHCAHMAIDAYKIETYRRAYEQAVYPLLELSDWEAPDELMIVNPPVMEIHQAGRPKNTNRIPSQGEEPKIRREWDKSDIRGTDTSDRNQWQHERENQWTQHTEQQWQQQPDNQWTQQTEHQWQQPPDSQWTQPTEHQWQQELHNQWGQETEYKSQEEPQNQ
ncbi:unnamed protein product [Lactuca saligna]|uniref:SWIM-type domain-containing protein n=1 Tax=Lactuca saligna TaxID=75948 RepID=A0AA35ZEB6_LACSI|nr:unnamed protein product [Lactuca saligna]